MRGRFDDLLVDNVLVRGTMRFGPDANHSLAFYGVTPISQLVTLSPVTTLSFAASLFAAGQAGFTTTSQADGLIRRIEQIHATLVAYGLQRGT